MYKVGVKTLLTELKSISATAALRVAIDIETPIVFLHLSPRAAQRSRRGNRPLFVSSSRRCVSKLLND